jgi:thiosulfate dehydrogenase [quinone] large subunit
MLSVLRMAIGWHFLYEGVAKLLIPGWSSEGYLSVSKWILAPVFKWIAATPPALAAVDFLNIWGLILIGLGLMFGVLYTHPPRCQASFCCSSTMSRIPRSSAWISGS